METRRSSTSPWEASKHASTLVAISPYAVVTNSRDASNSLNQKFNTLQISSPASGHSGFYHADEKRTKRSIRGTGNPLHFENSSDQ